MGFKTSRENIESEAHAISLISKARGHPNIVEIHGHGWLLNFPNIYFIDMELCNFSLAEYISYHNGGSDAVIGRLVSCDNSFLHRPTDAQEKIKNVWAIGNQIASALSFLHSHGLVHRDVIPRNGTCHQYFKFVT